MYYMWKPYTNEELYIYIYILGIHIFEIYLIYVEYACKHEALHEETKTPYICVLY